MTRRRPRVFDLDDVAFDDAPDPAPDNALDDAPDEAMGDASGVAREGHRAEKEAAAEEPAAGPRRHSGQNTGSGAGREARRERRGRGRESAEQASPAGASPGGRARAGEDDPLVPAAPPVTARRGVLSWFGLFAAGLLGLSLLALSLALTAFVADLFVRFPALGGLATALAVLMLVGLLGMVLREWVALRRLAEVEALRVRAEAAVADDDTSAARLVCSDLADLYADRPTTARGRKALKAHMREVIDGRDLVVLAEREVLAPLDKEAVAAIVGASRRVAAVTALSPRALVDLGYVIFASVSLVRRIATIYGGRPGTLGFLRVLRHAIAQLAVTGGMAAGDSLVGEVIGQGLAARLSAKLGEGVVNGLMTARLGLAALDVLRPLPFTGTRRPRVSDVLSEISRIAPRERG